ncbi:hypothetical protein POM88_022041 [Heracleum sosnowskyi]|uniref:Uncharacterized protein n=1 Tax=Heracleum sosnowskyi TaxID=360622 RepID=A0AAD8IF51_9APIA|nr:hypothetical protein POM88_022041 [Heracleum sosnowskyi]
MPVHAFDNVTPYERLFVTNSSSHTKPANSSSQSSSQSISTQPALRRSTRSIQPPAHFQDYVCNLVSFSSLPSTHQAFLVHASSSKEPSSYHEASLDSNWVQAM